ncbi:geraniol 8-hydroxylase-like [Rhododendron vialii]|uniref:geraniol 8-hydroxylase-like n=1 Tax=Rhododendron vialii TaxID=182163 RepID=UPI00265F2D0A|nr:geraniol 8-hydroxylase-like [Rhododendron vialii]
MVSDVLHKIVSTISNQWTWWWDAGNKKDEIARAVLTISILLLPIFYYRWTFLKSRNRITAPLPPGPRGLPMVGYLPFLGTNLHQQFAELAHQYGPIYKLWLGGKLCVVLNSPSLAKEVTRDKDTVFSNRDPPIAALAGTYGGVDIAWSPYGSYWRTMRKLFVREMLSNTSLEDTYNLRRDEVKRTIRELHSKIGTAVEVSEITFLTELNVVMSMLWGSTVDSQRDDSIGIEFRAVILKMVELLAKPNMSDFFRILARFDVQGVEREMKRLLQWVERILDPILEARMKISRGEGDQEDGLKRKGKKDFIQILLELKEQEDVSVPITLQQIKAMLLDIVVGGTDTTATTVEWVMAELIHKPEKMKKVQEELSGIVGLDSEVEESHLPKLHYLDAVLKETFRLHPPLPLLVPKRPNQSSIVGGYTIPKDTRVFLNVWAMHRDPEAWDDPSEFKPERFLSDASKWDYHGNNFQFLPFGSGRRICAGIPLAEKMVMYVLASLLHSFNWKLPEDEELDLSEKFGVVMKKSKPLIAIPTQRLSCLKFYE